MTCLSMNGLIYKENIQVKRRNRPRHGNGIVCVIYYCSFQPFLLLFALVQFANTTQYFTPRRTTHCGAVFVITGVDKPFS